MVAQDDSWPEGGYGREMQLAIKAKMWLGFESERTFFFPFLKIFIVMDFVIHWNETAMDLCVCPIPIPPPTSLSTRSL